MGQGSIPCPGGHFLAADLVEFPTHLFPHPSSEALGGLNVMSVRRAWHAGSAHVYRTLWSVVLLWGWTFSQPHPALPGTRPLSSSALAGLAPGGPLA